VNHPRVQCTFRSARARVKRDAFPTGITSHKEPTRFHGTANISTHIGLSLVGMLFASRSMYLQSPEKKDEAGSGFGLRAVKF
jgi:hypothetical protein